MIVTTTVNLRYSDSKVIFDKGNFDNYCVYIVKKDDSRTPPKDIDYFNSFRELHQSNSNLNIYQDFVKVYDNTGKKFEQSTIDLIDNIVINSGLDGKDKKVYEGYLVVIYMAMIAEENKKYTRLGKRIKRLGMYNLLIENMDATSAANNSRGKNWQELDKEMKARGF